MTKQLKGTLEEVQPVQLLHLINLAKKTGTLHVFEPMPTSRETITRDGMTGRPEDAPGKEKAKVYFKAGKLIYAATSTQDGHLASVLHKAGELNDEQYRIVREKADNASDKALAHLLINANYVTQQVIIQSVLIHTLDIIYELIMWNKEPFIFQEDELPPPECITLSLDLDSVIMEAMHHKQDIEVLTRELPNLDFALRFPEGYSDSELFKGIQLSVEEWRVISWINPKNSIRHIAKACNMTEMEIRRVVYGLMNAGLVELVKP